MKYLSILLLLMIASFSVRAQAEKAVSYNGVNWSPDSKWLAFTRMDITQSEPIRIDADVYIVATDGSGLKRLTGDGRNEFEPVFTGDRKSILFGSINPQTKAGDLYSVRIDGNGLKELTANINHASAPQISHDRHWVAFNATLTDDPADHLQQIFIMRSDGSGVKQLTNDGQLAYYDPVWSPSGKRLVYYVERGDKKDQIWTMNADGTDQKLLTNNIGHNFYPSWSPDGKRIIFTSNREGKHQLYTMNSDGSDIKAIGIEAFYGRISPDGKKIAYIGGQFPNMSIFIANIDGSDSKKLLN